MSTEKLNVAHVTETRKYIGLYKEETKRNKEINAGPSTRSAMAVQMEPEILFRKGLVIQMSFRSWSERQRKC